MKQHPDCRGYKFIKAGFGRHISGERIFPGSGFRIMQAQDLIFFTMRSFYGTGKSRKVFTGWSRGSMRKNSIICTKYWKILWIRPLFLPERSVLFTIRVFKYRMDMLEKKTSPFPVREGRLQFLLPWSAMSGIMEEREISDQILL